MASLTVGSGSAAGLRQAKAQAKVSPGSISCLRVKPFTRATRSSVLEQGRALSVRTRAAEPEVAAPTEAEETFQFNFTDAKKGNQYEASDVEAAIAFYQGEGDAPGEVNGEFVENVYGVEDASFFDDIDNTAAYDDEFVVAGIPEAAPKQKGRGSRGDGADDGEDGDEMFAAAKQVEQQKNLEEEMVLAAELEETGLNKSKATAEALVGPAVWDWVGDLDLPNDNVQDDESLSMLAATNLRTVAAQVAAALPSDEDIFADLRTANLNDLDPETKETIEFLLDDFDIDAELKAAPEDLEEALSLPDEGEAIDMDRIDALLASDLSLPELDVSQLENIPELVDDGLTMSDAAVEKYIASLRSAEAVAMSAEEVQAMFADDPSAMEKVTEVEPPVDLSAVDLSEPALEPLSEEDLVMPVVEDNQAELPDLDDYRRELESLELIPDITLDEVSPEEVDVLEQYLNASDVFIAEEENRRMQLAQQVAAGALSADVLLEESGELPDVETELLMPEDDSIFEEDAADDFEEDDENWQERILELTRVTKVVKGGKLMGFRCTAVVGNGKGLVGVGCQAGREIATAVKRALVDAKKSVVMVPLVGAAKTVPHRVEAKFNAARCVIVPAADGTGVLAGSSIRSVLELAGVQNVLAKRIGCRSLLNNARCAVAALQQLKTLQEVAKARGVPMERLLLPQ